MSDDAPSRRRRGPAGAFDRVVGAVVPAVVRNVDADDVLERVDVDALVQRIDVDELVQRVDVDALLDRVDVNRLLDRVDVDALLDRVDVNRLLDRVEIDRLLGRVDVNALVVRAQIADVIAGSGTQVAEGTLDLARRQLVGIDAIVMRVVTRLLRRDPTTLPSGPPALVEPT